MSRSILLLLALAGCGSDQGGLFVAADKLEAGAAAETAAGGQAGQAGAAGGTSGSSGASDAAVDGVIDVVTDAADEPEAAACQPEGYACGDKPGGGSWPPCCEPFVCQGWADPYSRDCHMCQTSGSECTMQSVCCPGLSCQFDGIGVYRCS